MTDAIGGVPSGYVVHRIGDTWLVLDRAAADDLIPLRLADAAARRALFARAPVRGRGAAPSVPLSADAGVVLRRYRHGGLLARITGPLFWGPQRALAELEVTARAEASGAPVPHVLCLAVWPALGPLWSALIGTREVRGAQSLAELLAETAEPRERARLAREVGGAVRRLHDAGVEHRDLQVANVLVAGGRVLVIDLDRARFHAVDRLGAGRRARNLGRLVRSAVKVSPRHAPVGRRELSALAAGYTAGDRALRRDLRRLAAWERLKLAIHRLSYPFRRVGAGPSRIPRGAPSPPRRA